MSLVDLERPWAWFDASGNKLWGGVLRAGRIEHCLSAEASVTLAPGEPVRLSDASSVFPRWDLATTADPIKGVLAVVGTTAAAETGMFGVVIEQIKAGEVGRVAAIGSLVAVKCKNPPGSNVRGSMVISDAAVARQVDAAVANASYLVSHPHVKPGLILGYVAQPAGVGAGQTGSLTQLGILVNPS
jgi:hypothetical protein